MLKMLVKIVVSRIFFDNTINLSAISGSAILRNSSISIKEILSKTCFYVLIDASASFAAFNACLKKHGIHYKYVFL